MDSFVGLQVCLRVREWFAEPEFQAWFNQGLGKGLATWRHADNPLPSVFLCKEECARLAKDLEENVITSDVLFEPIGVGTLSEIKAEEQRLKDAEDALEKVVEALSEAAGNQGLSPSQAKELSLLLNDKVVSADVLFEPAAIADPEVYEDELDRLELAEETLFQTSILLAQCANEPEREDLFWFSDCFVGVDPAFNGEGTDSDMPSKYWDVIVEAAKNAARHHGDALHVMVRLSPEV